MQDRPARRASPSDACSLAHRCCRARRCRAQRCLPGNSNAASLQMLEGPREWEAMPDNLLKKGSWCRQSSSSKWRGPAEHYEDLRRVVVDQGGELLSPTYVSRNDEGASQMPRRPRLARAAGEAGIRAGGAALATTTGCVRTPLASAGTARRAGRRRQDRSSPDAVLQIGLPAGPLGACVCWWWRAWRLSGRP